MTLIDLIREKGIDPKKVANTYGGEYHSPCPGCGGTDRFHIWPEQNNGDGSWWCRQCRKAGDKIQFLIEFDGCTFKEACERLGENLPPRPLYREPQPAREQSRTLQSPPDPASPVDKWQEKGLAFVDWSHQHLMAMPAKLKWLSARGIRKRTAEHFRLGWNPGKEGKDLWRPREFWGLPTELKNNGQKKRLWLPRGLVIPYFKDGSLRRIRIRRPGKDEPRFYVIPGSAMDMMFIPDPNARAVVVVEAELDALLVHQEAGQLVGVLALGSASTKPHQSIMDVLASMAVILLSVDSDPAGAKAFDSWWSKCFSRSKRWPVPDGKDPGDAYKADVDIQTWIYSGLPPGWHFGPSIEKNKKKKTPKKQEKMAAAIPEGVVELAELLKNHPVSVHVTVDRTYLRHTQKWARENWEAAKRVSELVFMTDSVVDYIEAHPQEIITGENIVLCQ